MASCKCGATDDRPGAPPCSCEVRPPKPVGPPNRLIKEGEQPLKPTVKAEPSIPKGMIVLANPEWEPRVMEAVEAFEELHKLRTEYNRIIETVMMYSDIFARFDPTDLPSAITKMARHQRDQGRVDTLAVVKRQISGLKLADL